MQSPPPLLRPDTLLFIYYIDGAIPAHQAFAVEHFIGNWVEDDFSFLFFTRPARLQVLEILAQFPGKTLLDEYEMTYAQWQGGNVEPVRIGRFLLNPTWIKPRRVKTRWRSPSIRVWYSATALIQPPRPASKPSISPAPATE